MKPSDDQRPSDTLPGTSASADAGAIGHALERTVREQERKRIAQELHDDIGQQLSALELTARRVERLAAAPLKGPDPLGAAIRDLQGQIESALVSVKRMTRQLQPLALETLGFPAAIESMAAEFANRSDVRLACRFRVEGLDVSEGAAVAIYRIVQEALGKR